MGRLLISFLRNFSGSSQKLVWHKYAALTYFVFITFLTSLVCKNIRKPQMLQSDMLNSILHAPSIQVIYILANLNLSLTFSYFIKPTTALVSWLIMIWYNYQDPCLVVGCKKVLRQTKMLKGMSFYAALWNLRSRSIGIWTRELPLNVSGLIIYDF